MRLDIYHHFGEGGDPVGRILDAIASMEERIMAKFDTVKGLLTGILEHTNTLASNIEQLIAMLQAQQQEGLTPDQTAQVIADLTAHADHLKAVGERSDDPLPAPPAPPEPLPEPQPEE